MHPTGEPPTEPPQPCPVCGTYAPGSYVCPRCGAPLDDDDAARLRAVNAEMHRLWAQRNELIGRLQARGAGGAPGQAEARTAPGLHGAVDRAPARALLGERSAQTLLAAAGVALLAVAAVVFTAVTWQQLAAPVRAAILVTVTAAATVGARWLVRRGLQATGEAVAVLGILLTLVTVHGSRALGVAGLDGVELAPYLAATSLLVAAGSYPVAAWTATRSPRVCAALLLLVPGPAAASWIAGHVAWADEAVWATVLVVTAVALEGFRRVAVHEAVADVVLRVGGGTTWLGAVGGATLAAVAEPVSVWLPAGLGVGAVAAVAAWFTPPARGMSAAAALAATVVTTAAAASHVPQVDALEAAAGTALAAALAALALPTARRRGWMAGTVPVASLAVVAAVGLGVAVLAALWDVVADPWAVGDLSDTGDADLLASAAALVGALAVTAASFGRRRTAVAVAAAGAVILLAAATVVAGLPAVVRVAVGSAVVLAAAAALRERGVPRGVTAAAVSAAVWSVGWSLADPWLTVATLAVVSVGFTAWTALGVRLTSPQRGVVIGTALAAGLALAPTAVAAAGQPSVTAGLIAVVTAGVTLVVASRRLEGADLVIAETVIAVAVAVGLYLAGREARWLAVSFAVTGVAAAAHAARPDRRGAIHLSWLALSATTWTLLAEADIELVEAYTATPAVLTLAIGVWRLARDPQAGSFGALTAGLSIALAPTALQLLAEPSDLPRVLGLAVAGTATVLVGAFGRLAAAVVYGALAIAVVVVTQLAVAASHLPRWVTFAALGLLLVAGSATYERQLARLAAARRRLGALR